MLNNMDLIVQETRNGMGIVAAREFAQDETLFEVTGEFISGDADDDIDEATRSNTFRFSEELYISPEGTIGDYQNHSCEPNAMVVKTGGRLLIVAVQKIAKGEEALIDYSTIIADDDIWQMQCTCGSQVCRGTIKSFDTLPPELQEKYFRRGMVPHYIAVPSAESDLIS